MTDSKLSSIENKKAYAAAFAFILKLVAAGVSLSNISISNFENAKGMEVKNKKYVNREVVVIPQGSENTAKNWLIFREFGQKSRAKAIAKCAGPTREFTRRSADGTASVPTIAQKQLSRKFGAYSGRLQAMGMLPTA